MVQSALNPFQLSGAPRSFPECLAAVRDEVPDEATVSSMAERFAPEALKTSEQDQQRPLLGKTMTGWSREARSARGVLAILTAVALAPAAILAALLWIGALRQPGPASAPDVEPEGTASQQAAVAAAPALGPSPPEAKITLTVPDHIGVLAGEEIDFAVGIASPKALPQRSLIAIRGLPEGATFSHGRPFGENEWSLRPDEAGSLRLRLPQAKTGPADLRVELLAGNGKVLASAVTRLDIAPDEKAALIVRAGEADRIEDLIAHGNKMIAVGYLAGARAYFSRAAEAGSAEAALALGATYDPDFIAVIGAQGIKADPAAAKTWYDRAAVLGVADVEAERARLKRDWAQKDALPQSEPVAPPEPEPEPGAVEAAAVTEPATTSGAEWLVTVSAVNVRAEPSSNGETLKVAQKGTRLRVTGRDGNWVKITDPATKDQGWIYKRFLEPPG